MSKERGFPHRQPFCINGKKNLTKRRAWWQLGNSNNQKTKKPE